MTDIVLISLIAAVPSTLAALTGVANMFIGMQHARQIAASVKDISETKVSMAELEKNTNSMKDALVKVTSDKAFAEGVKVATDAAAAMIAPPTEKGN